MAPHTEPPVCCLLRGSLVPALQGKAGHSPGEEGGLSGGHLVRADLG